MPPQPRPTQGASHTLGPKSRIACDRKPGTVSLNCGCDWTLRVVFRLMSLMTLMLAECPGRRSTCPGIQDLLGLEGPRARVGSRTAACPLLPGWRPGGGADIATVQVSVEQTFQLPGWAGRSKTQSGPLAGHTWSCPSRGGSRADPSSAPQPRPRPASRAQRVISRNWSRLGRNLPTHEWWREV